MQSPRFAVDKPPQPVLIGYRWWLFRLSVTDGSRYALDGVHLRPSRGSQHIEPGVPRVTCHVLHMDPLR